MFDILQAFFWSVTYLLLIAYALRYKNHGIPLTAICLNYAWETIAFLNNFIYGGFSIPSLIHLIWLVLDTTIVVLFIFYETNIRIMLKQKLFFLIAYFILLIIFFYIFEIGYMLVLCFIIDLVMAISFVAFLIDKNISKNVISIMIAFSKLFGDVCAWIFYRENYIVDILGVAVLFINSVYIIIILFFYKKLIL